MNGWFCNARNRVALSAVRATASVVDSIGPLERVYEFGGRCVP